MSFFKKMLASVGIGAARINTELDTLEVAVGGEIGGTVYLEGGQADQSIDNIYLKLKTHYIREQGDSKLRETATIAKYLVTQGFELKAGERKQIPFRFRLPDRMPVTLRNVPIWIETGLDIDMGVDPKDEDLIHVVPDRKMRTVLDAVELLGFRLREVTNDYAPRLGGALPFVQEFEYAPGGRFYGYLDELEILFFPKGDTLELILQVDRRARGLSGLFAEALELDERFVRVRLSRDDLLRGPQSVAAQLEAVIARHI
ncbi:sporulation-control protein [Paenibacillus macerans]|uniref:Sporulation protein SpoOM n=1 Tax=Paenibacillus macerans TaxID=44252 RepID=A0A6N8ERA5_PAEMA|nr:sporulation protein [Paenibacillus macerans]MED4959176.1 sporulation protein [Paenibacillus macerans]MUG21263.1 sporulation protein SpoOM [Paenibacillus macerans]OMG49293.1 sporulation protein SpoOM [Paenibacillus macerans]GJM71642.1 sporulation-control protein [Paenibacillus macerans]